MEGSIINRTIKNYNDVLSSQKEETNYIIATCYTELKREYAFQLFLLSSRSHGSWRYKNRNAIGKRPLKSAVAGRKKVSNKTYKE